MCECQPQTTTEDQRPSLAEVAREVTDNGRIIFEFLSDVVQGKLEGATLWHRLEATRQLRAFGIEIPEVIIEAAEEAAEPRTESDAAAPAASSCPRDELIEFVRSETDNGKDVLRFLLDVVRDRVADAKLYHRIAAAKELRHYLLDDCYHDCDDEEWDDDDDDMYHEELEDEAARNAKQYNDEDDPFDFENYSLEEYARDLNGRRAVVHIFGGQEGRRVALDTVHEYWTNLRNSDALGDYDETPIENPEDDPYGKGCYGYRMLKLAFEENGAVRAANKAVLEYHRRKFKHLLNKDGTLVAGDETASLDPKTLQYLERNRHLLAQMDESSSDTPVPPVPSNVILERSEESPSRDHAHPPTEPTEKPPKRRRRRKPRRIIHLGPPDEEDPPDDNSRPYRDPDEIRVPLRDLVRFTYGPL